MRIKLWNKDGTFIIDTKRDYVRCKESIDLECGTLEKYEKMVLEDTKTRNDILKYEIIN